MLFHLQGLLGELLGLLPQVDQMLVFWWSPDSSWGNLVRADGRLFDGVTALFLKSLRFIGFFARISLDILSRPHFTRFGIRTNAGCVELIVIFWVEATIGPLFLS